MYHIINSILICIAIYLFSGLFYIKPHRKCLMRLLKNIIQLIKNILFDYLTGGTGTIQNPETSRYFITINSLNAFGVIVCSYFAIKRLLTGDLIIGTLDGIMAILFTASIIYMRITRAYRISGMFTSFIVSVFYCFLFANGSQSYSGALWSFLIPFFISSMIGKKMGAIYSIGFFFVNLSISTLFSETIIYMADYDKDFLLVYFIVFFLISVLAYIVESVRDKTQQRLIESNLQREQIEEQLHQSQRMESIGQLAGGIAHEFNNMLNVISGYSELLMDKFDNPNQEGAKMVTAIHNVSIRAADLTSKLLAFARKGKYVPIEMDLNSAIKETIEMLEHTIDRRIRISSNLTSESCIIMGDRTQIGNMILNIALNARDAMPYGGMMKFLTEIHSIYEIWNSGIPLKQMKPGRYIKVTIEDDGIGMDSSIKEKIFEPFFTTKPPGKGTGLGLASVYGIVQSHGGCIEVESKKEAGTTFRLFFPSIVNKSHEGKVGNISDSKPVFRQGTGNILVVDDELILREMLSSALKSMGYKTQLCRDGLDAINYFTTNADQINLVLLDIVMPGLDGLECFRALKKIRNNVKVVVMSGFSIDGNAQKMLDEGALAFIHKPFNNRDLNAVIYKIMTQEQPVY